MPSQVALEEQVERLSDLLQKGSIGQAEQEWFGKVDKADGGGVEDALWNAWRVIVTTAERTPPSQQGPLVTLLQSVKQSELLAEARKQKLWGNSYAEGDLPLFGPYMREALDTSHADLNTFLHFSSFAAQVTVAQAHCLLLHGLWTVREAIEDHAPEEIGSKALIPLAGASAWLQFGGKAMWTASKENYSFDQRIGRPGAATSGQLSDDVRGFTVDRWRLWKARLHEASAHTSASDEVAKYLSAACLAMDNAEHS